MNSDALTKFDGQLIDGLEFCKMAYSLFEDLCRSPEGRKEVQLRSTKLAKLLVGELLPVCRYVQTHYRLGRYISVRWMDGSQSFDAELHQYGGLVEQGYYAPLAYLEATCAMHENEHWIRCLLSEGKVAYAPEGISAIKGKSLESRPVVFTNGEHITSFAPFICDIVSKKASINYPIETSLVVQCYLNSLYTPNEWRDLIIEVEHQLPPLAFKEVLLFDSASERPASLIYKSSRPVPVVELKSQ
jgi:hypothetical protein